MLGHPFTIFEGQHVGKGLGAEPENICVAATPVCTKVEINCSVQILFHPKIAAEASTSM